MKFSGSSVMCKNWISAFENNFFSKQGMVLQNLVFQLKVEKYF